MSQVFRVSAPIPLHANKDEGKDEDQCETSGKPHVEKLLGNLEDRVAAVEVALGSAMGGISNILTFMSDIKRQLAKDAGVQSGGDVEGVILEACKEGASAPSQISPQQTHLGIDTVAGGNNLGGSQTISTKQSLPQTPMAPGASLDDPLVVCDDTSSQSVGRKRVGVRTRDAHDSPAKRVHTNPRIRTLPVEGRLGVQDANFPKGKVAACLSEGHTARAKKHKDPPGQDDATDFGYTSDSELRLPALGPKSHSVSTLNPVW